MPCPKCGSSDLNGFCESAEVMFTNIPMARDNTPHLERADIHLISAGRVRYECAVCSTEIDFEHRFTSPILEDDDDYPA